MSLVRSPSLSTKIVGVVAALLAMMAAAAIYSYVQIQSVREEVLDVTVHLDSVEDALSLVTLRKLEKSNYYQRALRNLEAWALNRTTSEGPAKGPEIADEDIKRFEELGEELATKILAARETLDQALDEVSDKDDAVALARLHSRDRFEEGLAAYRARRWDDAAKAFQEVLETQPDDGPSRVFLERIEVFRESPPDDDWDGVCHMTTK